MKKAILFVVAGIAIAFALWPKHRAVARASGDSTAGVDPSFEPGPAPSKPPGSVPAVHPPTHTMGKPVFPDTDEIRGLLDEFSGGNPDAYETYSYLVPLVDAALKCAPETPTASYFVWLVFDLDGDGDGMLREVKQDDELAMRDSTGTGRPIPQHLLECIKTYAMAHRDALFTGAAGTGFVKQGLWIDLPIENWYPRKLALQAGWMP